jgi:filamentous hemagglutinin family protein
MRSCFFPVIFGFVFFSQSNLLAQTPIRPDTSLSTQVTTTDRLNFTIDGGGRSGRNLFHSFESFSIPTGGSAHFNNAIDVQNIFSRITGSSPSQIDGILRANGNANVFLLNPHGLWFGRNAQLAIGGSFLGTTASSLQFSDGVNFSAVSPTALLSLSVPVGLQMGQNAGSITLTGNGHTLQANNALLSPITTTLPNFGLAVPPGETLGFVANGIALDGGVMTAPSGRLELGSVQDGSLQITMFPQGFNLNYGDAHRFNDIHLSHRSLLNINLLTPGSVQLQGKHITFQDGSLIWSQNRSDRILGNIQINASGQLQFIGVSPDFQIASGIVSEAVAQGVSSPIDLTAAQVRLEAGATLISRNFLQSSGSGNITLQANDLWVTNYVTQQPDLYARIGTVTLGQGRAGDVFVNTNNIQVLNGGYIGSTSIGAGRSGDVSIQAKQIDINGFTPNLSPSIIAASTVGFKGDAGNLTIQTERLNLANQGLVTTSSIGIGSAGNIIVNATESINIESGFQPGLFNSSIASTVSYPNGNYQRFFQLPAFAQGKSGNVTITTPRLRMTAGAGLGSSNTAIGNGGKVQITANEVDLNQSRINAAALNGDGGNLKIQANILKLRNATFISATAGNTGNGGNIEITAPVILGLENSDILANASQGRGGNIRITTEGIIGLKFRPKLTPDNDITASSEFGVNGTVAIQNFGVEPDTGLLELSTNVIDPTQNIITHCDAGESNYFIISGRGGMAFALSGTTTNLQIWHDLRSPSPTPPIAPSRQSASILQAPHALKQPTPHCG